MEKKRKVGIMNIKKLILATVVVTVFSVVFGMVTCGGFFNWVYKLEPTNVWRDMTNFSLPLMIATTLFIDLLFVFVYALINKGVPGQNKFTKGLVYGLLVCLVGIIPGMIYTYLYQTIATTVIIYWTISGLIVNPLKGLLTAYIYEE